MHHGFCWQSSSSWNSKQINSRYWAWGLENQLATHMIAPRYTDGLEWVSFLLFSYFQSAISLCLKKGGTEIGLLGNKVLRCCLAVRRPGADWTRLLVLYPFFRNSGVYAVEGSNWEKYWQRLKSSVCVLNKHTTAVAWLCLKVQASVSFFLAFVLPSLSF